MQEPRNGNFKKGKKELKRPKKLFKIQRERRVKEVTNLSKQPSPSTASRVKLCSAPRQQYSSLTPAKVWTFFSENFLRFPD
jgi:hypothetical protein